MNTIPHGHLHEEGMLTTMAVGRAGAVKVN